jgi:hypothetical protein
MLSLELSNQKYNKSVYRRALQEELDGRSEASIELKHRNISAVLLELGCPYISGYKPLPHYQRLLENVVSRRLQEDSLLDRVALSAVEMPAVPGDSDNYDGVLVTPPVLERIAEPAPVGYPRTFTAIPKRDYLDREARNRSLGDAGEAFVISYERHRLVGRGRQRLADQVEHVSRTRGDGLGFDVLSFDDNGRERFIEVKTTSFGKATPFFLSSNELEFSEANATQYRLYRVFNFRQKPRLFDLQGSIRRHVALDPISYMAKFV